MDKIEGFIDSRIKNGTFNDMIQLTLKIPENYNTQNRNTFGSVLNMSTMNILIVFMKIIQKYIKFFDNVHHPMIFIRYWKNVKNELEDAYTIAMHKSNPTELEEIYKKFLELKKIDTQNANIREALYKYRSIANNEDFNNVGICKKEVDLEEYQQERSKKGEELSFIKTFNYENTQKILGLDNNVENVKDPEDINRILSRVMEELNTGTDSKKKSIPYYIPSQDYVIYDTDYVFWEVIERLTFPWYNNNMFEIEATKIMDSIAKEKSLHLIKEESIEVLYATYKTSRIDWLTPEEIEIRRKKRKKKPEVDKETSPDDLQQQINGPRKGNEDETDEKEELKNKKKNIYFDEKYCKYIAKEYSKKLNRIFFIKTTDMGDKQDLKDLVMLGKEIIKNILEDAEKIPKVFNGLFSSQPAISRMPTALFAIQKKFKSERKPYVIKIVNNEVGILGNFLIYSVMNIKLVAGHEGTAPLIFCQLCSRDSINTFDRQALSTYTKSDPGFGKSKAQDDFKDMCIPGTVVMDSVSQTKRAGTSIDGNTDHWAIKMLTEAGANWTQTSKLNASEYETFKKDIDEMTRGFQSFRLFYKKEGAFGKSDDLTSRSDFRIQNLNWGGRNYVGNKWPVLAEALDRFIKIELTSGGNRENLIRNLKEAEETFKDSKGHMALKREFFEFMQELQADIAIFGIYDEMGCSNTRINNKIAMMVANFCLNKLREMTPYFKDGARKFIFTQIFAIVFGKHKTKIQLSNIQKGIYYGVPYITDIAKYCKDFSERLIIGYDEIIPALFLMIGEYVDDYLYEIVNVFKKRFFQINGNLDSEKKLADYFEKVICSKNNIDGQKPINFKCTVGDKPERGRLPNGPVNGNTLYQFGRQTEKMDPNVLVFETELSKEVMIEEIIKALPNNKSVNAESIAQKIEKMKKMSIQIQNPYESFSSKGENTTNIYDDSGSFQSKLVKDKTTKNRMEQMIFIRYNSLTKKTEYRIPVELFNATYKSGYEILEEIVTKYLPYKNQGKFKMDEIDDRTNYNFTIIDTRDFTTKTIKCVPHKDSPKTFKMENVINFDEVQKSYYDLLKLSLDDKYKDENFQEPIIKDKILEFNYGIEAIAYKMHMKNHHLSEERLGEILREEEELVNDSYNLLKKSKLGEIVTLYEKSVKNAEDEKQKKKNAENEEVVEEVIEEIVEEIVDDEVD